MNGNERNSNLIQIDFHNLIEEIEKIHLQLNFNKDKFLKIKQNLENICNTGSNLIRELEVITKEKEKSEKELKEKKNSRTSNLQFKRCNIHF